MSLGYVEELAERYFSKKGYIVIPNIRFQLDKQKTAKKVAGWSDIDMLALNPKEILIVQCKSFLGTKKSEEISSEILKWYEYAEHYINNEPCWKQWLDGRETKWILIVDWSVKKAEDILKKKRVDVILYDDILIELLSRLSSKDWRKGKEDDSIIRLLCAMIDSELIDFDKIKKKRVSNNSFHRT